MGVISKEDLAEICYTADTIACKALGIGEYPKWEDAEDWEVSSILTDVKTLLDHPSLYDGQLHDLWMANKISNGWKYGEELDFETKEDPCIVPFDYLDEETKARGIMFNGIVRALAPLVK